MKNYTENYGDQFRWFVGTVINNNDPMRMGRVQVRIKGAHSDNHQDIPNHVLPWASVMVPTTEGGTSGLGRGPALLPGAQVVGFFMDGPSSQLPLVLGSIPRIEVPSNQQLVSSAAGSTVETVPRTSQTSGPDDGLRGDSQRAARVAAAASSVGGSNNERAYNFLYSNLAQLGSAYPGAHAAGFVGNFIHESGKNPIDPKGYNPNDVGMPAFGIAQWRDDRLRSLEQFASINSLDIEDLDTQLLFLLQELGSTEARSLRKVLETSNAADAANIVAIFFERPARRADGKVLGYDERVTNAEAIERSFG